MKKLLMAGMIGLLSGTLYAACMGPFCYDDTGASVGGIGVDGNGFGMPTQSSTTIQATTPRYVGQEIMCNTCVNGGTGKMGVCVDTAAAVNSWVMISSSTQKCQ